MKQFVLQVSTASGNDRNPPTLPTAEGAHQKRGDKRWKGKAKPKNKTEEKVPEENIMQAEGCEQEVRW